jgi:hypothetical protein
MRIQLVVLLVAASQLGATDCGQAIKDPGFDLWCGDTLCDWTVERGVISKVPTWNEGDPGVSLDGNDVAIEQVSPVAASDGACIELDMIANVEDTAQVAINFDIYDDGSVDDSQIIPTSSWQPVSFIIDVAGTTWTGMRFEITKTGSGHAVLAQISATVLDASQCFGFTPVVPVSIPIGAACATSADCGNGNTCQGGGPVLLGECVGCTTGSAGDSCGSGESCGLGVPPSPIQPIPTECVATGSQPLGVPCFTDAECATGICTDNACSACRIDGEGCGSGVACAAGDWSNIAAGEPVPWVCAPGKHELASGAACVSNADCASTVCNGQERMQCDDGRTCASDADCPFGGSDVSNPLDNGPCQAVGIQGGSCQ